MVTNVQWLSADEIAQAAAAVKAKISPKEIDGYKTVVASIELKEPNKAKVMAGTNTERRAVVLLYENFLNKTNEFVVLLNQGAGNDEGVVESQKVLKGVIPPMNFRNSGMQIMRGPEDTDEAFNENIRNLILADTCGSAKFRKALKRRNINIDDIGYFGSPISACLECTFELSRVVKSKTCSVKDQSQCCPQKIIPCDDDGRYFILTLINENIDFIDGYIDGFIGLVNITKKENGIIGEIIDTIDLYKLPKLQEGAKANPLISHPPLSGIKLVQEGGPSYQFDEATGHLEWDNWHFDITFDGRTGIEFYNIKYFDCVADRKRDIIYKASVSDAIVIYNTDKPLYLSNFISSDTFSYPMGYRLIGLRKGEAGIPDYATLVSIPTFDNKGNPDVLENVLAIYEQPSDALWRGVGSNDDEGAGASGNDLVIRSVFSGFFYLWQFTWVFKQNGMIEVSIVIGGRTINQYIDHITDEEALNKLGYLGKFITNRNFGLNHTHIHNLRFDFAVDGLENRLVEESWRAIPEKRAGKCGCGKGKHQNCSKQKNGCGHSFQVTEEVLRTEKSAVRDLDPANGVSWLVENHHARTPGLDFEKHPGYALVTERNGTQTQNFAKCSSGKQQFLFTQHNVFGTRYHEEEQYASGNYPIQQNRDTGLGQYIADDEEIVDQDIVLWHTMMISHQPHTEDFPLIPLVGQKVRLEPHNFFSANPALTITDAFEPDCKDNANPAKTKSTRR